MSTLILKEAVEELRKVVVKQPLIANRCDNCNCLFKVDNLCGVLCGRVSGIFDKEVQEDGRSLGNMFIADACSFRCADELISFSWKKLKKFKLYNDAEANIIRASLTVQQPLLSEEDLLNDWNK